MRGESEWLATMMFGLTPEGFVPKDHPLRWIKPKDRSCSVQMARDGESARNKSQTSCHTN